MAGKTAKSGAKKQVETKGRKTAKDLPADGSKVKGGRAKAYSIGGKTGSIRVTPLQ